MEVVKLLIMCLAVFAVVGVVYLLVVLLTKDKKEPTNEEILQDKLTKRCNECKGCCDDPEHLCMQVFEGEKDLEDLTMLSKLEKDELTQVVGERPDSDPLRVAFIACRGGNHAVQNYIYDGAQSCAYLNENYEGPKLCKSACLGCMDCAKVCPTGAIRKTKNNVAEVDRSLCIGCGKCVKACPDNIIKLLPTNQEVAIACNIYSKYFGGNIKEMCAVGCTNCEKCVQVCPTGALTKTQKGIMFDNSKCKKCFQCVYACPSNTITRLNSESITASVGKQEKKV